ncbi:MAG: hypothetical protein NZ571_10240 [Anaerolineae bacterium]|nr:hypothetical protein [Anaerolineae bacterium]
MADSDGTERDVAHLAAHRAERRGAVHRGEHPFRPARSVAADRADQRVQRLGQR